MEENYRQRLMLIDRKSLEITGISSVDSYDSDRIELSTVVGGITISGQDLAISDLNLEVGRIGISGMIMAMIYGKNKDEKTVRERSRSVIKRILK